MSTAETTGTVLSGIELSIEIFPPRSPEAEARLWENLEHYVAARPRFISVTCGAGGTGEVGTFPLVTAVAARFGLPVAAHLTCAGGPRAAIDRTVRAYWEAGIRRLVALRGDAPKDTGPFRPHPEGYQSSVDLVGGIRAIAPFDISVGCYPEIHPDAAGPDAELEHLKRKVEAGADRLITQYCFETETILRFRDRLAAAGITAEFVPGIMPIHNFRQVSRFSAACGASIPDWLARLFDGVEPDTALHGMVAANVAVEQCRRLRAEGITAFHVYALNRAELPAALVRLLGVALPVAQAA